MNPYKKKFPQKPRMKAENVFVLSDCLGEGTHGTVWTANKTFSQAPCAVKVIKIDKNMKEIENEVNILKQTKSLYVVKFIGSLKSSKGEVWIAMEHCTAGSLNDIMYVCDRTLSLQETQHALAAVTLGLNHLHKHLIIHRDIKAANILLTGDGNIRLSDFSISKKLKKESDRATTAIGALFWMAPEVFQGYPYDCKADVWSLGITMIEVLEGRPPFSRKNALKAIFEMNELPTPKLSDQAHPKEAHHFVKCCLTRYVRNRSTSSEIVEHKFLKAAVRELKSNTGRTQVLKALAESSIKEANSLTDKDFVSALDLKFEESVKISQVRPLRDVKPVNENNFTSIKQRQIKRKEIIKMVSFGVPDQSTVQAAVLTKPFIQLLKDVHKSKPTAFREIKITQKKGIVNTKEQEPEIEIKENDADSIPSLVDLTMSKVDVSVDTSDTNKNIKVMLKEVFEAAKVVGLENQKGELVASIQQVYEHLNISEEECTAVLEFGEKINCLRKYFVHFNEYVLIYDQDVNKPIETESDTELLKNLIKFMRAANQNTKEGYLYLTQDECLVKLNISKKKLKRIVKIGLKKDILKYQSMKGAVIVCFTQERQVSLTLLNY